MDELSDREILLLLRQEVKIGMEQWVKDQQLTVKRLDSHARDIKALRDWRNYYGGIFAAITAYLGIKHHGG